jgi:heterodisulfide reductase subunit A-like polyferredoxin
VELPNEYDEGLSIKKATFKQYAQAIPGAFAIQKTDKAPCRLACPAGLNVQGYVQMVKQGKYMEALQIIMEDLPLPGVLGRICPHSCEDVCRRCSVDAPVAIRDLKRLAADQFDPRQIPIDCLPERPEKVAIIGSGPAGLSAAYHLARKGVKSVIYEALPEAGGMLRVGIPDHRLPRDILDREIEVITNLGVEIRCNTPLGPELTIDQLLGNGYKAVYLALGAHKGIGLGIAGEETEGVRQGVDFLREVNLTGKAPVGRNVVIIGGGNVAVDVSRAAMRLGAETVTILYRRTRVEMPAWEEELCAAEDEGVKIEYLTAPEKVLSENGKLTGIRCVRMELGEPDASGRRRPVEISGSAFDMAVDQIIPAIGQRPDFSAIENVSGIKVTRYGTTEVDPVTYAMGRAGVFAGGDVQTGPGVAIAAIAAGREAAESIVRFFDGKDMAAGRESKAPESPEYRPIPADVIKVPRAPMPHLPVSARTGNFNEVELGFAPEAGQAEAERCLNCGYCSECYQCVDACLANAICHDQLPSEKEIEIGAVILSPGFTAFDPTRFDNYQYANLPNVVTSTQFERLLSASGPTQGHVARRSKDHKDPKKIAWFQCVGSRDLNRCDNAYCSSVCCMYALKQAVIAKEHVGKDLECTIFYMDMRTHGKDFERYYNAARDKHGIRFERSKVHTINPARNDSLEVQYITEEGRLTRETYDMIVLSVGLETNPEVVALANKLEIDLTPGRFCETDSFSPVASSKPGIFVCGAFQGPKDIPQSVVDASAAAAAAGEILAPARNTLTKAPEKKPEINIAGERPRIGVFVCRCGTNIAGVVDTTSVTAYAKTLPYVEYANDNMYSCSQDTQDAMTQIIKEQHLNRVVVAACTPRTHEPLFQETLISAGLNKYLFEMANIRNHDSWVHKNNPELATLKAKDLIRSAVSKVALAQPLSEAQLTINQNALVIGGGLSGMAAAQSLAGQGYETHIVEQADRLGGQALHLAQTAKGENVKEKLKTLVRSLEENENITIHLNTRLADVEGFVGSFKSTLTGPSNETLLEHGVAVIATGGHALIPHEYEYGKDARILTSLELDQKFIARDPILDQARSAVFIQCVGSREPDRPYCSRVCCTHSVNAALALKRRNPEMNVYILYRDIRTYGERELLYQEARREGVIFIRYSAQKKPKVTLSGGQLCVEVIDHVLGWPVRIEADILTLATAILPNRDEKLANFFKVPVNDDGFFVERHAKLGPSEFATDGVFLCGLAHYPKPIDEAIAQGKAAASRAITLLARKTIFTNGQIAETEPMSCSRCGVCVSICPYSAPSFIPEDARMNPGKAQINPVLCKGCGLCVASCRSGAIHLKGFDNEQIFAQIFALNMAG